MPIKFSDLEMAFGYVSGAGLGEHSAYFSRETSEMYWLSEFGDSDELPEDFEDSAAYVAVPHKNDLDLGVRLVEEFVEDRRPEDFYDVRDMFRERGGGIADSRTISTNVN